MAEKLSLEKIGRTFSGKLPAGSSVWLYGSRARGEERPDSDWDVLILIDKARIEQDDFDNISYPLIEFGWKYGADISPQLYTHKEWKTMHLTPYCQNVEHDKKVIYES